MIRKTKRFRGMTAEQMAQATSEYDKEDVQPRFGRPPAKLREAERLVRRGRPVIGKGAQRVTITVERALLDEANRYARSRKLTRSELIALGLRMVMGHKRSA